MSQGDIFVTNADGGDQIQITNDPGFDESPAWSPDGSRIAFVRQPPREMIGPADIWIMDADGTNQTNVTNTPYEHDRAPSWSPRGDRLVFAGDRTMKVITLADSAVVDLGVPGESPAWSPDGGRIAFYDPSAALGIMNADGTSPVIIASGFVSPDWSPDGKNIVVVGGGHLPDPIRVIDECGENGYFVPIRPSSHALQAAWSPDGTRLVIGVDSNIITSNVDGSEQRLIVGDVSFDGVDWQPLVETPPNLQPRSHSCVGPVGTEAAPTPPISLPRPGGANKDRPFAIIPVAATLFAIAGMACAIALAGLRR